MMFLCEVSREAMFREAFSYISDMFSYSYTQSPCGAAYVLQMAWAFDDVGHVGGITGDEFFNFILLEVSS